MEERQIDINTVIEEYRREIGKISHELIMVRAYARTLEKRLLDYETNKNEEEVRHRDK